MRRDETGSVVPLLVGFAAILALLVGVVVDASAAYLRRQGLHAVAEAAALSATEGLQGEAVYTGGLGPRGTIDVAAAASYVAAYLRDSGAQARYPGLRYAVDTRDDTVLVRLQAPLQLPIPVPGVTGTATVTGTAAAQVLVTD